MMNTSQIQNILAIDPFVSDIFAGVYPSDLLPVKLKYPCCLVANTDKADSPGEHWVCMYFTAERKGEFFDSYGFPPEFYAETFRYFLKRHSVSYLYSKVQLQDTLSSVCGPFCIFFVSSRARGLTFEEVLKVFSKDVAQNDKLVSTYVKHLLKQSRHPVGDTGFGQSARPSKKILKLH